MFYKDDMLYFVSSNVDKFREVKRILGKYNIDIEFRRLELLEIQSDSLEIVAKHKVNNAYSIINDEVIVEDDGLFINSLNGFPGVYSSYVFKTIGNDGILKLLRDVDDRSAKFISIIAYSNGSYKLFKGIVKGSIAYDKRGYSWGYDPIFIPKGYDLTYAELKNKDEISHRYIALNLFARWYKKNKDLML
ncbi:MAG: non-canonical purine NTP pyrophosphatase [Candidatus Nitrosocaldaceae archaeon]|nr:MAG: non-canonical purine NTP pyrophosphatase [Candidatus Nitrosocaldaceae archaeon]